MNRVARSTCILGRILQILAFACLLILSACGGGGGSQFGDAPSSPGFSPGGDANYTFGFEGVDDQGRMVRMNLFQSSTTMTGTFTDGSNLSFSSATDFQVFSQQDVTGSYDAHGFTVTVTASGAGYQGIFVSTDVVHLTAPGSTQPIVLVRNSNGQFVPHMSDVWSFTGGTPHRLQLGRVQPDSTDGDTTVQVQGTEILSGVSAPVSGYASVSHVHLTIARSTGTVSLDGFFAAAGSGWDQNTIVFGDGSTMVRGGTPDAQRVLFALTDGFNDAQLVDVDSDGVQRRLLVASADTPDVLKFVPSPDKTRVALIASASALHPGDLHVIDRSTGLATRITNVVAAGGDVFDVAWSPDGSTLAYIARADGSSPSTVFLASPAGTSATSVAVAKVGSTEDEFRDLVVWSNDGRYVAFVTAGESSTGYDLRVAKGDGSDVRTVWTSSAGNVSQFAWSSSSDVLAFTSDNASELWTADVGAAYISGALPPAIDLRSQGVATFAWSPDGVKLAFVQVAGSDASALALDTRTNTALFLSSNLLAPSGVMTYLSWSPDSSRVAYLPVAGSGWVIADGVSAPQILADPGAWNCNDQYPSLAWSPDSSRVAYLTAPTSSTCALAAYVLANQTESLISQSTALPVHDPAIRWLNDSKRVLVAMTSDQSNDNLFVADIRGTTAFELSSQLDASTFLATGLPIIVP